MNMVSVVIIQSFGVRMLANWAGINDKDRTAKEGKATMVMPHPGLCTQAAAQPEP